MAEDRFEFLNESEELQRAWKTKETLILAKEIAKNIPKYNSNDEVTELKEQIKKLKDELETYKIIKEQFNEKLDIQTHITAKFIKERVIVNKMKNVKVALMNFELQKYAERLNVKIDTSEVKMLLTRAGLVHKKSNSNTFYEGVELKSE